MHNKRTSAQLKQGARGIMLGKYRNAITLLLASDLILNTITLLTATSYDTYMGIAIGLVVSLVLALFGAILNVGQCSFYLNIACGQKYEFNNLFTGFKVHPDKTIIIQLLLQLFTTLPLIPALAVIIITTAFYADNIVVSFFIACILLIIGAGFSWWIALRFSQLYYLLLDFPDYSALELMKLSWRLMKGNVGRLLYIQVSFIPMTLAGLISFGIGLLLVQPYQNMTYALFYLDLMKE